MTGVLGSGDYLALHARVEPDMQNHGGRCPDLKTFNLTRILEIVEDGITSMKGNWDGSDPSASSSTSSSVFPPAVFLPLDRRALVAGAAEENGKKNPLAAENLATLQRIENDGMFGGRSRVFGMGDTALADDDRFEGMGSTAGSLINFYLALGAHTFVGTPISTYSTDVW